jgi:8-oxo-dGTP diphosphatase
VKNSPDQPRRAGRLEPAVWYDHLPTTHVLALALIRDDAGRVLVVKPGYRPYWTLPGGMADENESPDAAAGREVGEELGVALTSQRLVVVDWSPARGDRHRPLIAFVFAGETTRGATIDLQRGELDDWRFAAASDLDLLMPPKAADRARVAVRAAATGSTAYLLDGTDPDRRPDPT